jgi:hypothetical protein
VACEFYRKATRYITISGNSIWDVPIANIDKVFDATYNELVARRGERGDSGGHREIDLDDVIKNGRYELFLNDKSTPDKSRAVWYVINTTETKVEEDKIVATYSTPQTRFPNTDMNTRRPRETARDQIAKAREQIEKRLVRSSTICGGHASSAPRYGLTRHWRGDSMIDRNLVLSENRAGLMIKSQIWKYLEQALTRNKEGGDHAVPTPHK